MDVLVSPFVSFLESLDGSTLKVSTALLLPPSLLVLKTGIITEKINIYTILFEETVC